MFSYEANFDYLGLRWEQIDLTGTKGDYRTYGELGRLPSCVFILPLFNSSLQSLDTDLRKSDRFSYLLGRIAYDKTPCRRLDLIQSFLIRATRAVEGALEFLYSGDVMNAWTMIRVLIERYIWMAYILRTDKAEEFYEFSALQMKKWAYRAACLGFVDPEAVEDYDDEMEDALGHRLGRPAPQWDQLTVERMCLTAFDRPLGDHIYRLYQLASMSTHPSMDDCGEYFRVASVMDMPSGHIGDDKPLEEILQTISDVFARLISLAEAPVIDASTEVFEEDRVRMFLTLRHEPGWRDNELLAGPLQ